MNSNYPRWLYGLVILLTIIAGLYLSGWIYGVLQAIGNILALYFMAWLLQFMFTPVVDFLVRRGVPRVIGVSAVYLALLLLIAIFLTLTLPAIYSQGQSLARQLGRQSTYTFIESTAQGIEKFLHDHFGVHEQDIRNFTNNYSLNVNLKTGAFRVGVKLQEFIQHYLNLNNLGNNVSTFLGFLNAIGNTLLNFVLVLLLAFYMTLDGHKVVRRVLYYFPPAVGEVMGSVRHIINRKFGGYLRGQIILALSYGLLTYLIALGFHLGYPVFIGIFAAIMMLIPFIGTFAAIVPPLLGYILVHLGSFQLGGFLLLLAFLVGSQQIVLNLLAPRVMGTAVGLHPLLVVLGLLLGTKVAGLWGAIFGVPIFGVLIETADLIYRRASQRYGFPPPVVPADDTPRPRRSRRPPSRGEPNGPAQPIPARDAETGPTAPRVASTHAGVRRQ